jgi:Zn-dependent metalloprotease
VYTRKNCDRENMEFVITTHTPVFRHPDYENNFYDMSSACIYGSTDGSMYESMDGGMDHS